MKILSILFSIFLLTSVAIAEDVYLACDPYDGSETITSVAVEVDGTVYPGVYVPVEVDSVQYIKLFDVTEFSPGTYTFRASWDVDGWSSGWSESLIATKPDKPSDVVIAGDAYLVCGVYSNTINITDIEVEVNGTIVQGTYSTIDIGSNTFAKLLSLSEYAPGTYTFRARWAGDSGWFSGWSDSFVATKPNLPSGLKMVVQE